MNKRTFTMDDQVVFADVSGDHNPLHMDPVFARRTRAGGAVVHGLHILCWAMERLIEESGVVLSAGGIRAEFKNFLLVGQEAEWHADEAADAFRVVVRCQDAVILQLRLRPSSPVADVEEGQVRRPVYAPCETPLAPSFGDIEAMQGLTPFFRPSSACAKLFPSFSRLFGQSRVAALICSTRIVGMVCPGRHSIFNGITADLTVQDGEEGLRFAVRRASRRYSIVTIAASGGGLRLELQTMIRPAPVSQPHITEVARLVRPSSYEGVEALIIGGSRGLGELTAKLLLAGGAHVTITYVDGHDDAKRLVDEVTAHGYTCRMLKYDASRPADGQLSDTRMSFSHIYYYATPKISRPRSKGVSDDRFKEFYEFYVQSFSELCIFLDMKNGRRAAVLYPSSVAVRKEERPVGWAEYAMAKAAGEVICEELDRDLENISVSYVRLPRLATDQTVSMDRDDSQDDSAAVMAAVIDGFQRGPADRTRDQVQPSSPPVDRKGAHPERILRV